MSYRIDSCCGAANDAETPNELNASAASSPDRQFRGLPNSAMTTNTVDFIRRTNFSSNNKGAILVANRRTQNSSSISLHSSSRSASSTRISTLQNSPATRTSVARPPNDVSGCNFSNWSVQQRTGEKHKGYQIPLHRSREKFAEEHSNALLNNLESSSNASDSHNGELTHLIVGQQGSQQHDICATHEEDVDMWSISTDIFECEDSDHTLEENIASSHMATSELIQGTVTTQSGSSADTTLIEPTHMAQHRNVVEIRAEKLASAMATSSQSQGSLQDWDHQQGLPKSHSSTMTRTSRSRQQLQEGKILLKWNGDPLIGGNHHSTAG